MEKPTHGSLCSGIGGFDLGGEAAGFDNVWACEINKYCRGVLKEKFNHKTIYNDVNTLNPYEMQRVNVISAGFPCQDISVSNGKGKGLSGAKSSLFYKIIEVCGVLRPEYILLENSPNLINRGFESVLREIAQIGYDAEWSNFQGFHINTPQKRERLYIIAYPHAHRRPRLLPRFKEIATEISSRAATPLCLSDAINRVERKEYIDRGNGVDDVPRFAHKLGALGNAVMPLMAEALFRCLIF